MGVFSVAIGVSREKMGVFSVAIGVSREKIGGYIYVLKCVCLV